MEAIRTEARNKRSVYYQQFVGADGNSPTPPELFTILDHMDTYINGTGHVQAENVDHEEWQRCMNYVNSRSPLHANCENEAKRVQENLDARDGESSERLEPIVKRMQKRLDKTNRALEKQLKELDNLEKNYEEREKEAAAMGSAALEAFAERNPFMFE